MASIKKMSYCSLIIGSMISNQVSASSERSDFQTAVDRLVDAVNTHIGEIGEYSENIAEKTQNVLDTLANTESTSEQFASDLVEMTGQLGDDVFQLESVLPRVYPTEDLIPFDAMQHLNETVFNFSETHPGSDVFWTVRSIDGMMVTGIQIHATDVEDLYIAFPDEAEEKGAFDMNDDGSVDQMDYETSAQWFNQHATYRRAVKVQNLGEIVHNFIETQNDSAIAVAQKMSTMENLMATGQPINATHIADLYNAFPAEAVDEKDAFDMDGDGNVDATDYETITGSVNEQIAQSIPSTQYIGTVLAEEMANPSNHEAAVSFVLAQMDGADAASLPEALSQELLTRIAMATSPENITTILMEEVASNPQFQALLGSDSDATLAAIEQVLNLSPSAGDEDWMSEPEPTEEEAAALGSEIAAEEPEQEPETTTVEEAESLTAEAAGDEEPTEPEPTAEEAEPEPESEEEPTEGQVDPAAEEPETTTEEQAEPEAAIEEAAEGVEFDGLNVMSDAAAEATGDEASEDIENAELRASREEPTEAEEAEEAPAAEEAAPEAAPEEAPEATAIEEESALEEGDAPASEESAEARRAEAARALVGGDDELEEAEEEPEEAEEAEAAEVEAQALARARELVERATGDVAETEAAEAEEGGDGDSTPEDPEEAEEA